MQKLVIIKEIYSNKAHDRQSRQIELKHRLHILSQYRDSDTTPPSLLLCLCLCVSSWVCAGGKGRVHLALTVTPPWLLLHCISWIPKMEAIWLHWDLHTVLWESLERDRQVYEALSWDLTQLAVWPVWVFSVLRIHLVFFLFFFFEACVFSVSKEGKVATGMLSAHAVQRRSWGVVCLYFRLQQS